MRIHYVQHVPFEDLANIENWAKQKAHSVTATRLYLNETFPPTGSFDWLFVMGGPMNIYEDDKYPWLISEKRFIEETVKLGRFVLGICLGAQLIADVLGGKVSPNDHKEIGWFPVNNASEGSGIFNVLPDEFMAYHWHGDTFEIPPGATRLAGSQACRNQAFEYNGNVLGLQFHLESSAASVTRLITNCRNDMMDGKFVQSENEIVSRSDYLLDMKRHMTLLLDEVEKRIGSRTV